MVTAVPGRRNRRSPESTDLGRRATACPIDNFHTLSRFDQELERFCSKPPTRWDRPRLPPPMKPEMKDHHGGVRWCGRLYRSGGHLDDVVQGSHFVPRGGGGAGKCRLGAGSLPAANSHSAAGSVATLPAADLHDSMPTVVGSPQPAGPTGTGPTGSAGTRATADAVPTGRSAVHHADD